MILIFTDLSWLNALFGMKVFNIGINSRRKVIRKSKMIQKKFSRMKCKGNSSLIWCVVKYRTFIVAPCSLFREFPNPRISFIQHNTAAFLYFWGRKFRTEEVPPETHQIVRIQFIHDDFLFFYVALLDLTPNYISSQTLIKSTFLRRRLNDEMTSIFMKFVMKWYAEF